MKVTIENLRISKIVVVSRPQMKPSYFVVKTTPGRDVLEGILTY